VDIFSHGLWGATILRKRKLAWWAFLVGMAPDLLGSGAAFIYLLTIGRFWGTDTWQYLPDWTKGMYHFHHSLLALLLYFVALYLISIRYSILLLPYAFHILLDAFTHENNIFNRLFYPGVYEMNLRGLNWWEHWWIMALNVSALVGINAFFFLRKRLPRTKSTVAS
jgi:hypothetical protein